MRTRVYITFRKKITAAQDNLYFILYSAKADCRSVGQRSLIGVRAPVSSRTSWQGSHGLHSRRMVRFQYCKRQLVLLVLFMFQVPIFPLQDWCDWSIRFRSWFDYLPLFQRDLCDGARVLFRSVSGYNGSGGCQETGTRNCCLLRQRDRCKDWGFPGSYSNLIFCIFRESRPSGNKVVRMKLKLYPTLSKPRIRSNGAPKVNLC